MKHTLPHASSPIRLVAVAAAMFVSTAALNTASEIPESLRYFRPVNLDVKMRVDSGHDISLRLEPSQEPIGKQLDTDQMWKLDQIRAELPQRFRLLQNMFPRQIAEYLLRQGFTSGSEKATESSELAPRFAGRRLTETLSPDFAFDPDFDSAKKAGVFLALKKRYNPYREVTMTVAGDTLILGGKIITDRLRTDASIAGQTPEQYAYARRAELSRDLAQWRAAQISGDAYAGTIKGFLNDPRLAEFTPEETHRAYARIFGRDLKTDVAADRLAAKEGRLVTYAEISANTPR